MDADVQLTINSFLPLFHDKIFSEHFPGICPTGVKIYQTFPGFPAFSHKWTTWKQLGNWRIFYENIQTRGCCNNVSSIMHKTKQQLRSKITMQYLMNSLQKTYCSQTFAPNCGLRILTIVKKNRFPTPTVQHNSRPLRAYSVKNQGPWSTIHKHVILQK